MNTTTKEKLCSICKKKYVPTRKNNLTCSKECSRIKTKASKANYAKRMYHKHTFLETQCPICQESFIPKRSNSATCSPDCQKEYRLRFGKIAVVENKTCCICNNQYIALRKNSVTCSESCQKEHIKIKKRNYARKKFNYFKKDKISSI